MKYAILSDIHSNIQALESALKECDKEGVDKIICLGDVIGYNANPCECLKIAQSRFDVTIKGNHDEIGERGVAHSDCETWNSHALKALEYTTPKLTDNDKQWIRSLPYYSIISDPKIPFSIGHGTPLRCENLKTFDYIMSPYIERIVMKELRSNKDNIKLAFYGHTHIPAIFRSSVSHDGTVVSDSDVGSYIFYDNIGLNEVGLDNVIKGDEYIFINPGSIGQPRYECPPSFVILDTNKASVEFIKFAYDFEKAQKAIREAGYCDSLAQRLDYREET